MFCQKCNFSNFAEMYIVEHNDKIVFVGQNLNQLKSSDLTEKETPLIKKVKVQIEEYLTGKRTCFDIATGFVNGSDFQKTVWKQISTIPYGKTISYFELAESLNTKAVRAVGTACGHNPLCIIIPCHRVIRSNGQVGKYAFGTELKRYLLSLENSI